MGLSSSKSTSTQNSTSTPTTPSYVTPATSAYYGAVTNLGSQIAANPSMFATPANDTQLAAVAASNNLGSSWKPGLDQSSTLANQAGNTKFNPVTAQTATTSAAGLPNAPQLATAANTQLGPANQAQASSILDTPINNYLNPVTNDLVNTTLANYDQQSGIDRAAQEAQAAKAGAFGGSRYGVAQAQLASNQELGRASTEAGLRSTAFDKATNLAAIDAAARNSASQFNTGAQNDFALAQGNLNAQTGQFNAGQANTLNSQVYGTQAANNQFNAGQQNQASQFNAGAKNQASQFNTGLQEQQAANQLAAAGQVGNNAATAGSLAQQNAAQQLAAGNAQYAIDQANNLAPLTSLAAYNGLLDPALIASLSGQQVSSTGTSTQPGGIFGSLLGAGAQLGSAALLSDPALKRDVERIDTKPDGLGVYRFNYLWDGPEAERREGVMADEVARLRPWALGPKLAGFRTVDYAMLEAA